MARPRKSPEAPPEISARAAWALAAALLVAHVGLALAAASGKSLTYDEHAHLPAGIAYLRARDARLNPEHPPLAKCIAAAPAAWMGISPDGDPALWEKARRWEDLAAQGRLEGRRDAIMDSISAEWNYGVDFLYRRNRAALPRIVAGSRAIMCLVSALGGFIVFLWGWRAFGAEAGLVALALYAFSPNLLGHAPLAATDVCVTTFTTATLWAFHEYLISARAAAGFVPTRAEAVRLVALSLALAAMLLSKYSALGLLPFLALAWALAAALHLAGERRAFAKSKGAGLAIALALAAIWMSCFYGVVFASLSLRPYWLGAALVAKEITFNPGAMSYVMGKIGPHFYLYFAVALLVKMSLPSVALAAAGLAWSVRAAARRDPLPVLLALFAAYFFAFVSTRFPGVGVRHAFPLWPAMFLMAGYLWSRMRGAARARWIMLALLGWHVLEGAAAFPNYIPYMNELARINGKAYWLSDSNLDWGQDVPALARFMRERGIGTIKASLNTPADLGYYGVSAQPLRDEDIASSPPGARIALSVFVLQAGGGELRALLRPWRLETILNDTIYIYERP